VAPLLGGLGLFFIGVRSLSANLVPLIGQRARTAFAHALRGPVSSAISGTVAGLLTQSSTAVSWIILGLIRAGMPSTAWVLIAPAWSNVGTALLPILVAINLATGASYVIGLVGFAIYFKLDNTDRRRYALDAAFGAALLLFGMQVVSAAVGPMREALGASGVLAAAQQSFLLLAGVGIGFSMLTQSSSVAAAIAVAGVNNGLLTVTAALPLIAGANAAGIFNNLMKLRGETTAGGKVFMLQTVQKAGGTLLLTIIAVVAMWWPAEANSFTDLFGNHASSQIAIIFTIAQFVGASSGADDTAKAAGRGGNPGATGFSSARGTGDPVSGLGSDDARIGAADFADANAARPGAGKPGSRIAVGRRSEDRRVSARRHYQNLPCKSSGSASRT
jgi:phosphate:Na+ symporter